MLPVKCCVRSIFAGVAITMACAVYSSIECKPLGAFLFSFGLLAVLMFDGYLYTGWTWKMKTPWMPGGFDWYVLGLILLGNMTGCMYAGSILMPVYRDAATAVLNTRGEFLYEAYKPVCIIMNLSKGILCGGLMALAIQGYNKYKDSVFGNSVIAVLIVVLCVMGFILAGAEHSVADFGYMCISGMEWREPIAWVFFLTVVAGNLIGGKLFTIVSQEYKPSC